VRFAPVDDLLRRGEDQWERRWGENEEGKQTQ